MCNFIFYSPVVPASRLLLPPMNAMVWALIELTIKTVRTFKMNHFILSYTSIQTHIRLNNNRMKKSFFHVDISWTDCYWYTFQDGVESERSFLIHCASTVSHTEESIVIRQKCIYTMSSRFKHDFQRFFLNSLRTDSVIIIINQSINKPHSRRKIASWNGYDLDSLLLYFSFLLY